MRPGTPRVLVLSLLAAVLALGTLTAPAHATDPDPVSPAADDAAAAAKEVLAEVQDLFEGLEPLGVDAESDLTLALRDLALLKNDLPASLQPAAERLLARPTDGNSDQFGDGYAANTTPERVCSTVVCVHFVRTSPDQVPAADGDNSGVPDYVELALRTMNRVHSTYVAAGYRAPKSDIDADNNGGDEKSDVYLANIGPDGLYGYCATDQDIPANQPQDTWGYCVLDNDYRKQQFPTNSPADNFRVTAAHEYFHAVQFGYDISEDAWIMEATATWAEDEVFDAVDDNVQYLRYGPMRHPAQSMDQFEGLFHYGTWSFFRHLTERFRASKGGMPVLVRDLWRRLDDAKGAPDDYSLEGLRKVLRKRGLSIREAFAGFAAANRMPDRSYEESRANNYPAAPLAGRTNLSPNRRAVSRSMRLDHLAAGTLRFVPSRRLAASDWKLRLVLDLAKRWQGSAAVVTIKPRDGAPRTKTVALDRDGDARLRVAFARSRTRWVEVTVVNASDHFRCNRGTRFSCAGVPRFDGSLQRVTARAFRP